MGPVSGDRLPPFTKLINKCPATILAARRTDSVIGRMKFLTSSIIIIRGMSTSGVPEGTKWTKNLLIAFKINPISMKIHTQVAIPRVKEILLEGVKVYGVKPIKFIVQQIRNNHVKNLRLYGIIFSFMGILNSL